MDGSSPDEAHSVSAVAVIDLSDGGGGGADDPHGLLASSVVVIGGDDGGHDATSDGLMHDDDDDDDEDEDEDDDHDDDDDDDEASECGSRCGHSHASPTHMIHIGRSTSQGFIVTGKPPPPSPTAAASSSPASTRGGGSSTGKRKRVVLSLNDKQRVLQRLELGEQPVVIAREFGISRQQVSDIKKNKARILAFCVDAKHLSSLKRKTLKATTEFHPGVEQELYRWLIRQRRLGRAVTAEALTTKTTDLFMQYAADDAANVSFRSITVWLRHFKRAHGIKNMSEDELAKLSQTFTPAMEMNANGASDTASTTSGTAGGLTPSTLSATPKDSTASSLASVDDVSSYMNNVDQPHQSPFLLQNHAGHVDYGASTSSSSQSFQMFMLSSEPPPAPPQPHAPAPSLPLSLQSCAQIAQTLTLQLSLFEREINAKLHALDTRVQKLGFTVLSATPGARYA